MRFAQAIRDLELCQTVTHQSKRAAGMAGKKDEVDRFARVENDRAAAIAFLKSAPKEEPSSEG